MRLLAKNIRGFDDFDGDGRLDIAKSEECSNRDGAVLGSLGFSRQNRFGAEPSRIVGDRSIVRNPRVFP